MQAIGMESSGYYDLPKFRILGFLDALISKIYLAGWDYSFLTSYKPCTSQVPFRHYYKNINAVSQIITERIFYDRQVESVIYFASKI